MKKALVKISKGLLMVVCATMVVISGSKLTYANNMFWFFSSSDIRHFTPDDNPLNCGPGGSTFMGDSTIPAETASRLDARRSDIEAHMSIYMHASEKTGLPWSAIAALHFREASLGAGMSMLNGQPLAASGSSYINVDGLEIVSSAYEDAVRAGNHLISQAQAVYGITLSSSSSLEDFGWAFLAYNRGFMFKYFNCPGHPPGPVHFRYSPYVMNYFDHDSMSMRWHPADDFLGLVCDSRSNPMQGRLNTEIGALAVMVHFADEEFSGWLGSCAGMGGVVVNLNGTNYAWPVPAVVQAPTRMRNGRLVYYHWDCGNIYDMSCRDAVDIFADPGVQIVAITSGILNRVTHSTSGLASQSCRNRTNGARRATLQIIGDDGFTYFHTHLAPYSTAGLSDGQRVEAGQPLATMGDYGAADCTPPHLHISAVPNGHPVDRPWGGFVLTQEILPFLHNNR